MISTINEFKKYLKESIDNDWYFERNGNNIIFKAKDVSGSIETFNLTLEQANELLTACTNHDIYDDYLKPYIGSFFTIKNSTSAVIPTCYIDINIKGKLNTTLYLKEENNYDEDDEDYDTDGLMFSEFCDDLEQILKK